MKCLLFVCLGFMGSVYANKTVPLIEFELAGHHVRDFNLSADGQELYLTMESIAKDASQIIRLHKNGKTWSTPVMASFSGQFKDLEPFLHPNGLKLYFASNRDAEQQAATAQFDLWMTTRATLNNPWSKPVRLSDHINTKAGDEFYPSVSSNDNLYFTATKEEGIGKEDIYVSRWVGGKYMPAELLPATINSDTFEFNAYINPNETMLMFSSFGRKDGFGGGDLYISYKVDGQWQQAKNMGANINSNKLDYCPFYDHQTNTLYWTSNASNLADKTDSKKTYQQWLKLFTTGVNGMSKIYRQSIDLNESVKTHSDAPT